MIDMTGIDQLPSGAYRFRVRYRGELLSGTAPTPELAAQMRDELKRQIVDGDLSPTKGQTAAMLGARFLARDSLPASRDHERRVSTLEEGRASETRRRDKTRKGPSRRLGQLGLLFSSFRS